MFLVPNFYCSIIYIYLVSTASCITYCSVKPVNPKVTDKENKWVSCNLKSSCVYLPDILKMPSLITLSFFMATVEFKGDIISCLSSL
jgi:hypothetical protein